MPRLTIEGVGDFEVPEGKRLVLALGDNAGMTVAEKNTLQSRELSGVRLSCQILCDHDMTVRVISRLVGSGREDCGHRPEEQIHPQPVEWTEEEPG